MSNPTHQQTAIRATSLLNSAEIQPGKLLQGDRVLLEPLVVTNDAASILIGATNDIGIAQENAKLARQLESTFSLEDLKGLCFELGIPYEDIEGQIISAKARELIIWTTKRGRLPEVIDACKQKRPHLNWESLPFPAKSEIGVVVSMNPKLALNGAAAFIDAQQLDANMVLITNTPDYHQGAFLDVDVDWTEVVKLLNLTIVKCKQRFPNARLHYFLAMPVSLAFAFGCALGNVHQGDKVYHFQPTNDNKSSYIHVLTINRNLRSMVSNKKGHD